MTTPENSQAPVYPAWFPDDQHGYSIAICACSGGPYLGARKMGTPCCCERCGLMTQEQFDFLRATASHDQPSTESEPS